MKRIFLAIACALFLLSLFGCRSRTTLPSPAPEQSGELPLSEAAQPSEPENDAPAKDTPDDPDAETEPDDSSDRRAYFDEADAVVAADADHALSTAADAAGSRRPDLSASAGAAESENAEKTITETISGTDADRDGAGESDLEAESVLSYYQTLLSDRLSSLFECQRLYVYWETSDDYVTVQKASAEHRLILSAGAYDVSSKLQSDALCVEDGWILRKNPDVVVKVVDNSVLGSGVSSTGRAQEIRDALAAREGWQELNAVKHGRIVLLSQELLSTPAGQNAAALSLAKVMYPSQLHDLDAGEALRALTSEAGTPLSGQFIFVG